MVNILKVLNNNFPMAKKPVWKLFYSVLALSKSNQKIQFMNYGYIMDKPLELEPVDTDNQFRIQLYHRLLEKIDINGKEMLEIGCGRGGGCSYFARYQSPKSVLGIDLSGLNIKICKKIHKDTKNLEFKIGDAESLPVADLSYDIIINLESSHCYPNFSKFIGEAYRVLRNDGVMGYADFVLAEEIPKIRKSIIDAGFNILEEEDLTPNVLDAIIKDNEINQFKETNRILNINLRKLTGADGSSERGLIPMFKNKSLKHIHFLLEK